MIFNEKNEILMVERNKKPYKKYWGMPGGFVNYAEDPIKALGRELKEELGVKFNIGKIVGTYNEIYLNNGDKNERYSTIVIVYEIKFKEKDKKNVLFSNEVSKFDFFSKDNLPKKIAFKNQRFFLFENIAKNK